MSIILKPSPSDLVRNDIRRALLAASLTGIVVAMAGCGGRDRAPDFAYTLLDGSRHDTRALRGRVVLVNFWATSCAVCVSDMPGLVGIHGRYAGRGLQTLAVAMRHDAPAAVSQFAERRALPFGVVIDNTGAIAARFPDLEATPTLYLVDRRGHIARRHVGRAHLPTLQADVERLLAEPA